MKNHLHHWIGITCKNNQTTCPINPMPLHHLNGKITMKPKDSTASTPTTASKSMTTYASHHPTRKNTICSSPPPCKEGILTERQQLFHITDT